MDNLLCDIKFQLSRSWLKRETTKYNCASVALTKNGKHISGLLESRTHLLDVTSEHAALALAVACKDPHVKEVISVVDGEFELNPIVIKVLVDHVRRTGTKMSYKVFDIDGKKRFSCEDVSELFYTPSMRILEKISGWEPKNNSVLMNPSKDLMTELRHHAKLGLETHFSSTSSSRYSCALLAGGKIYYGGVYSSFDRRLNLHAEMVCALGAIAEGNVDITAVAIVSDKFVDTVPQMCGCCRQFLAEISHKNNIPIQVYCFSLDGTKTYGTWLSDYLPGYWDSGKSLTDSKDL